MSALTVTYPPRAEIVTVRADVTVDVVMEYVAVVAPAATVTLAGTWTAVVLLLTRVTATPPAGAGPLSVTVPIDGVPPVTEFGLIVCAARTGAMIVNLVETLVPR